MDLALLAQASEAVSGIKGNLQVAMAAVAIPLSVGLIGFKAVEAVGRNPAASGKILIQSIIAMAFAEAVVFFVIFLGANV